MELEMVRTPSLEDKRMNQIEQETDGPCSGERADAMLMLWMSRGSPVEVPVWTSCGNSPVKILWRSSCEKRVEGRWKSCGQSVAALLSRCCGCGSPVEDLWKPREDVLWMSRGSPAEVLLRRSHDHDHVSCSQSSSSSSSYS